MNVYVFIVYMGCMLMYYLCGFETAVISLLAWLVAFKVGGDK